MDRTHITFYINTQSNTQIYFFYISDTQLFIKFKLQQMSLKAFIVKNYCENQREFIIMHLLL